VEGSGHSLIGVLSMHLPGGTEDNHEIPHSGYSASRPRFEPGDFYIPSRNSTHQTKL
jgi:hypothetical protein